MGGENGGRCATQNQDQDFNLHLVHRGLQPWCMGTSST